MAAPIPDKGPGKAPLASMGQQILSQIKEHVPDTVAYVLLAVGLLYCFYDSFAAGILIGAILGVYFSADILQNAKRFKDFIVTNGIFKGFTLLAGACALIITAPGLCLGLLLGTSSRYVYGIFFQS